jgi:phosphatidylinositol-4,5-bisphosphate 3-kinase
VNWAEPEQASEARKILSRWARPPPAVGLELLSWKFADEIVRSFAVSLLEGLSDGDVANYLLQLVNVVKYELCHDSPLAGFLLRRGLLNKTVVGHPLYWLLKSEMSTAAERLGVILEAFLRGCGIGSLSVLTTEEGIIKGIARVAATVKTTKKEERAECV